MAETQVITNRYDFVYLFDVTHGNPNGDPDAGNAPRVDPETGYGLITDVCLKRKVRNFVGLTKGFAAPNDIYVKERGILAREQKRAYQAIDAPPEDRPNERARQWMCQNFFDVRTFGAVMTTGKSEEDDGASDSTKRKAKGAQKLWNCGQVRGPVQLGFATSQSPILNIEHTITRVALTNAGDTDRANTAVDEKASSGQMGRKHAIPYALYRTHGHISPFFAKDTGFSRADLDLFIQALSNLFEHDRSAARGEMSVRGLYLFEHDSDLGCAPAHKLFDLIKVEGPQAPRSFDEYKVTVPTQADLPPGVKIKAML